MVANMPDVEKIIGSFGYIWKTCPAIRLMTRFERALTTCGEGLCNVTPRYLSSNASPNLWRTGCKCRQISMLAGRSSVRRAG
jgi:hypothetical protein